MRATSRTVTPRITLLRRGTVRVLATQLAPGVAEPGVQLKESHLAAEVLRSLIGKEDREHFVVLLLNGAHRIVGAHTVSIGSANFTLAHPREVFKAAILTNSVAVICGHNHPSGTLEPSAEDRTTADGSRRPGKSSASSSSTSSSSPRPDTTHSRTVSGDGWATPGPGGHAAPAGLRPAARGVD